MRLSKRGEYGLRAMIDLATQKTETGVFHIKDIAKRQNIPLKFLQQILINLKNAGFVHSRRGVGGGYYLGKPANKITLGEIVRILDGTLAPVSCVSQTAYEPCGCPDERTCGLRLVMFDVRNAISDILDNTTLADVGDRINQAREVNSN